MARTKRLIRSFSRLLFPIIVLIVLAAVAAAIFLNYSASNPPRVAYLVTPEKYGRLSTRAAQVTEETWSNADGSATARGWLLRGTPGSPAVVLLHRYGADRSWVLDLGVKINEATNFTVLMPDLRGHGENPPVKATTLGGCEAEDVLAAIEFLKSLRTVDRTAPLVGQNFGVYGVELGGYSALVAASKNENIKALALDSVPLSSDDLLSKVIEKRFPVVSSVTSNLAAAGSYAYHFSGCYSHQSLCSAAKLIENRKFLLLSGADVPNYQDSTRQLASCLPDSVETETKLDLPTSGYGINNASLEQAAAYDQRVIEFFRQSLGGGEMIMENSESQENSSN